MAIGCILLGLSFLFMLLPVADAGTGRQKVSLWWLIAFYVIYTLGELYVSPIGLALVTKVAPARIVSMMMGLWLLSYAIGGFIAGYIGSPVGEDVDEQLLHPGRCNPDRGRHRDLGGQPALRPILERAQPDDALTPGVA
jgi:dipeptide/tripeptide permease